MTNRPDKFKKVFFLVICLLIFSLAAWFYFFKYVPSHPQLKWGPFAYLYYDQEHYFFFSIKIFVLFFIIAISLILSEKASIVNFFVLFLPTMVFAYFWLSKGDEPSGIPSITKVQDDLRSIAYSIKFWESENKTSFTDRTGKCLLPKFFTSLPKDPGGNPYSFASATDSLGATVFSLGPDEIAGTSDDIVIRYKPVQIITTR